VICSVLVAACIGGVVAYLVIVARRTNDDDNNNNNNNNNNSNEPNRIYNDIPKSAAVSSTYGQLQLDNQSYQQLYALPRDATSNIIDNNNNNNNDDDNDTDSFATASLRENSEVLSCRTMQDALTVRYETGQYNAAMYQTGQYNANNNDNNNNNNDNDDGTQYFGLKLTQPFDTDQYSGKTSGDVTVHAYADAQLAPVVTSPDDYSALVSDL
jgi:hypothetical protein